MDSFTIDAILAGTDLTERSDGAVRAAAAVAELTGAELHVLHAFDLDVPPDAGRAGRTTFPDRIAEAERALDDRLRRIVPPSVRVASRRVEIYMAHKAILEEARRVSADLIVLGRHRDRALADRVLGTTADHVVREAEVPCLVVPDGFRLPLRTVVAPVDPVEPARSAKRLALAWASSLGGIGTRPPATALHLLAVLPESAIAGEREEPILAALEEGVAPGRGAAATAANVEVRSVVCRDASPAAGILAYAGKVDADLVVIGTRAPGAVARALLGSVASAVAREAAVPVLLVPPAVWRGGRRADAG